MIDAPLAPCSVAIRVDILLQLFQVYVGGGQIGSRLSRRCQALTADEQEDGGECGSVELHEYRIIWKNNL